MLKVNRIVVLTDLITQNDKIVASETLVEIIVSHGLPEQHARHIASHEKSHALADPGPGAYGLLKNDSGLVIGAFYRYLGRRSPEVQMRIAAAGGALGTPGGKADTRNFQAAKKRLQKRLLQSRNGQV